MELASCADCLEQKDWHCDFWDVDVSEDDKCQLWCARVLDSDMQQGEWRGKK